ncbi:MAG: hypothetical protein ABSE75_07420 [Acidimicrobiales bacterium]
MKKSNWKIFSVGAVIASLTLAACGASASLNSAISSVSASQYLQVHFTASLSGADAQKAEPILSTLSYDVIESSTSGQSLSQSTGNINTEIDVNVGTQALASIRDIGTNFYFEVNAQALASLPSVNLPSQTIAAVELLLNNRWFEVPASLIAANEPTPPTAAQTAKEQAIVQEIINDLTGVIEANNYTTLPGGGFSQAGTLQSIITAVLPTIEKLDSNAPSPGKVPGTYTVAIKMSGSTATSASISITAPNGSLGNSTGEIDATIAHAAITVSAPTGATTITPAMITQLEGQVAAAQ